jgi:transcriptional regulator GlxA family with amidase domain
MQIAIVLYPGMTALDAIGPYEILRFLPDAELRLVGASVGPLMTDSNVLALGVTHTFDETPRPDLVLVPGSGPNTATAMADRQLTGWLQRVHQTTTWTTSVCSGALILAAAGLLRGHPATTHWIAQSALKAFGAEARREERIVRSGKIVTAAGVSAGLDLALWLTGEIAGRDHAELVQLYIEYDPQPPFDAGHPSKARKEIFERANKLGRQISMTPGEFKAVATVAWRRMLQRS